MKLGDLAIRLGAELRGDADVEVTGVQGIEEVGPTEITFVANPKYAGLARSTKAAAVVVEPEFPEITTATLRIKNPYHAFSRALGMFYQPPAYAEGVHPTAVIDTTAEIGAGAHVGAYVVIGPGVRIGKRATLLPHVVLYPGVTVGEHFFAHAHAVVREHCVLGDNVTLENGAIVGADGFGFSKNEKGEWQKIPQSGPVRLGNRVDVQANACVDRAALGSTVIGEGTKLDNMVHVGHNCRIGRHVVVAAQTGFSGGVVVEDHAIIGGQVGVGDKARIESRAVLGSGCGVLTSKIVHSGETVWGTPARPLRQHLEQLAWLARLPELRGELSEIKRRLAALETKG